MIGDPTPIQAKQLPILPNSSAEARPDKERAPIRTGAPYAFHQFERPEGLPE